MNRQIFLPAILFFFFAIPSLAQTGEKKSWSSVERTEFITECITAARVSMSADSARFYCYCMQEKIELKYPDPAEAAKITAEEMNTADMKKEVMNCLTSISWAKKDREEFLTSCVNSAKAALGETKAKTYCECMLYKVEKVYPNASDAGKLNAEELKKELWQKIIKNCMEF